MAKVFSTRVAGLNIGARFHMPRLRKASTVDSSAGVGTCSRRASVSVAMWCSGVMPRAAVKSVDVGSMLYVCSMAMRVSHGELRCVAGRIDMGAMYPPAVAMRARIRQRARWPSRPVSVVATSSASL